MQIAVAAAVIAGHNWPVFLRFNAGRGLATTIGISLFLFPWGIIPFVFFAAFTLLLGSSPLPLLAATASLPIASFLMQYFGHPQPVALTLGLAFFFILMVIRRLTAPRSAEARAIGLGQLLINRLLFDRDIRDGEAWVRRKPR
jgi:glycerol-3-phosphate acyltransferase PlsY